MHVAITKLAEHNVTMALFLFQKQFLNSSFMNLSLNAASFSYVRRSLEDRGVECSQNIYLSSSDQPYFENPFQSVKFYLIFIHVSD